MDGHERTVRAVALAVRAAGCIGCAAVVAAACAGHGREPVESVVDEIRATHPRAALLLADAARRPATASAGGFVVASTRGTAIDRGPWRTIGGGDLGLERDSRSGAARLRLRGGETIGVTRRGAGPGEAIVDDGVLVVRDGGSVDTLYAARPAGVEELLVVRAPGADLAHDLALPSGWTARKPAGSSGLIELSDARGRLRIRMVASVAWDATGRELRVDPIAEGTTIRLAIEGTDSYPVVVDPEWQGAGTPMARGRGTTTLLSNGKVLLAGGEESFGGKVLGTAELFDPAMGGSVPAFETTGYMTSGRVDHVAVPLPDGRVLLAGGFDVDDNPTSTAELYDPMTGTFEAIEPGMHQARARFTATLMQDGRVLIAGGARRKASGVTSSQACADAIDGDETDSVELFDPSSGLFEELPPMGAARADHTATLLPDGSVLIAAGQGGGDALASAERYVSGVGFGPIASQLGAARRGHTSILLPNGRVLIAGGILADDTYTTSAELFDPAGAGQFSTVAPGMAAKRAYAAAALLPDGTVLVAGGEVEECFGIPTAELFVPDATAGAFAAAPPPIPSNSYRPTLTLLPTGKVLLTARNDGAVLYDATPLLPSTSGTLLTARLGHTATLLPTGDVLVAGGDGGDIAFATTEIFRSAMLAFENGPAMNVARTLATATRLFDGRVLIAGGSPDSGSSTLDSAEVYDPSAPVAEAFVATRSPMSAGRSFHTATLLPDRRVLLAGGFGVNTVDTFDPGSNTFSQVPNIMSEKRHGHTATLLVTGKVLIAGGAEQYLGPAFASADLYDPGNNTISPTKTGMNAARSYHIAVALSDGRVLLAGGTNEQANAEIYDPVSDTFTLATPTLERYWFTATTLPSQKVLLCSGRTKSTMVQPHEAFELFDPSTGASTSAPGQELDVGSIAHTATLLPSGGVLVVGGFANQPFTVRDRWQILHEAAPAPPLGAMIDATRPVLASAPTVIAPGTSGAISGSGFRAIGQGSGGLHASPTNFPTSFWMPLDGPVETGNLAPWSSTTGTWQAPAVATPGPGLLFVVTNGLRSSALSLTIPPADDGTPCAFDVSCASRVCADGVCCDQECGGCSACTAALKGAGDDGKCEPVAEGLDPHAECADLEPLPECGGRAPTCDGAGECASCVALAACGDETTLLAPDGNETDCAPFRCASDPARCLTSCASRLDCAAGLSCTAAGECEPPLVDEPAAISCRAGGDPDVGGARLSAALLLSLLCVGSVRRRRACPRRGAGEHARACR